MDKLTGTTGIKPSHWLGFSCFRSTGVMVMFSFVGGVVVYGFALYGFVRFLQERNAPPDD